jgi:inner membrane protein
MNLKFNSLPLKLALVAVLALFLLIPLAMVKEQIRDRQNASQESIREVSHSWGSPQMLAGPSLQMTYLEAVTSQKEPEQRTAYVYPKDLQVDIQTHTQILHRAIFDILVYKADVVMSGYFIVPETYAEKERLTTEWQMRVSDLRGIEGSPAYSLGALSGAFEETVMLKNTEPSGLLKEEVAPERIPMDGSTAIPFSISFKLRGSSELMVRPYGEMTRVKMQADCPNPSFTGDFLPLERDIRDDGFTAAWEVSKINRGNPDACSFGVRMLQDVTQYQQSTRSAKYGILVILLVFLAGLAAEFLMKRPISLVQYAVIGLSLVLFYALVLAFSEFMPFGWAYLLSALMTVTSLTCYFRAILRSRTAYVLGALTALAYLISYILLQMETYAFLCGTLLLFVLLAAVMYFTRNLSATPPAGPSAGASAGSSAGSSAAPSAGSSAGSSAGLSAGPEQ